MLDKLAAAATVMSSVASGVSLLRSINTPMPKMPEIDYEGHNIAVEKANKLESEQREKIRKETRRMKGLDYQDELALAREGESDASTNQSRALQAEQAVNTEARQRQLQMLELESSGIETALRKKAQAETDAQKKKQKNRKIALITGTRGRRALLTSGSTGYGIS